MECRELGRGGQRRNGPDLSPWFVWADQGSEPTLAPRTGLNVAYQVKESHCGRGGGQRRFVLLPSEDEMAAGLLPG